MKTIIFATGLFLGLMIGVVTGSYIAVSYSAGPNYCTPETPYAPYSSVCTGYATYCWISPQCTTTPGVPGTQNPNGYTPICSYESCRPVGE